MASKLCVWVMMLALSSLVVAAASYGPVVMEERGEEVRHGEDYSFVIISNEGDHKEKVASGPFYFGLGDGGLPVRTGMQVTLGRNGTLMACKDGKVEWLQLPKASSSSPPELLLSVGPLDPERYLYILEFSEPRGAYVTDPQLSTCSRGAQATPFKFLNTATTIAGVAQA